MVAIALDSSRLWIAITAGTGSVPIVSDAVAAMDFTRRAIISQTGRSEYEVEKADTAFAGLSIQQLRHHEAQQVVVLTDDRVTASEIRRAIEQQGYGMSITVLRRSDVFDTIGEFGSG